MGDKTYIEILINIALVPPMLQYKGADNKYQRIKRNEEVYGEFKENYFKSR